MTQISYQLTAFLAESALYQTYRGLAYLPDGETRDVLLKRLQPNVVQDPVVLSHLAGFSDVARGLQHPNLAPIWDLGQYNGSYFYIREYLPGCSLRDLINLVTSGEAILSPAMAIYITCEIVEAIAALHRYRVPGDQPIFLFHGGLSPENIVLTRIGGVAVTDSGLDVIFWRSQEIQAFLRDSKGAYQPPEYSAGKRPMRRGDAYGVASLLYHMLMGQTLWEASPNWHESSQMALPSQHHPRITEQFDQLLMETLHPEQDRRQIQIDHLRQQLLRPGLLRQAKAERREATAYIEALVSQAISMQAPETRMEAQPPFQLESLLPSRTELLPPHKRYQPPQFDATSSFHPQRVEEVVGAQSPSKTQANAPYPEDSKADAPETLLDPTTPKGDDSAPTFVATAPQAPQAANLSLGDLLDSGSVAGTTPPPPPAMESGRAPLPGHRPPPPPPPQRNAPSTLTKPAHLAESTPSAPAEPTTPGIAADLGLSQPPEPAGMTSHSSPPLDSTYEEEEEEHTESTLVASVPSSFEQDESEELLPLSESMELISTDVPELDPEGDTGPEIEQPDLSSFASQAPASSNPPAMTTQQPRPAPSSSDKTLMPPPSAPAPPHSSGVLPQQVGSSAPPPPLSSSQVSNPGMEPQNDLQSSTIDLPEGLNIPRAPVHQFPATPQTMAVPVEQVSGFPGPPPSSLSNPASGVIPGSPQQGSFFPPPSAPPPHSSSFPPIEQPVSETVALPIEQVTGSQSPPPSLPPSAPQAAASSTSHAMVSDDGLEHFGKFVLLNRVAFGGMAEVFRARLQGHVGFQRIVALKRILPEFSEDPAFIEMFTDEARIAGSLTHPHIVQINELGEEDGIYYISMEFIDGIDLARVIKIRRTLKQPIPLGVVLDVAIPVCKALHYAHTALDPSNNPLNMIHRDVTPHNILISKKGEIKLTDFGIAKASQNISTTAVGELKGKLSYMSPEQAEGKKLDQRTDIFQVGIVLYEMLTLRKMFEGKSDQSVLHKIQNSTYPKPRQISNQIPEYMEQIALKALAVDSRNRYQTAQEMEHDLVQLRNNLPPQERNYDIATFTEQIIEQRDYLLAEMAAHRGMPQAMNIQGAPHQNQFASSMDFEAKNKQGPGTETRHEKAEKKKTRLFSVAIVLVMLLVGGLFGFFLMKSPPPPPPKASISIQTRPSGAEVRLDGERLGVTPLKTSIPFDTVGHVIQLVKRGYRPFNHKFKLQHESDEVELFLNLSPNRRRKRRKR